MSRFEPGFHRPDPLLTWGCAAGWGRGGGAGRRCRAGPTPARDYPRGSTRWAAASSAEVIVVVLPSVLASE